MKFILLILLPTLAHAFTLNNSIGARYKEDKVQVRAGLNSNCVNVDMQEVAGLIDAAIKDFWNTVPTSRLQLEDGGSFSVADTFVNNELCLIGGACGGAAIPAVTDIVITCNSNATNFPGGSNLLALTLPTVISGKDIKGSVVIINEGSTTFKNLNTNQKISVISHEIGHAIGLGHSDDRSSLMFFSVVPVRNDLGRDDIDGVTYLYPVQGDLFGLGCFLGSTDSGSGMWPTALLGFLLAIFFGRRFRRTS
ncbi:MAG: M57 family metalloprotease [Proteobacteria bacterium]|jgi:hypothetical protein|nr:M57 family metalloprotease [Pseudomonadota bacterium]